MSLAVNYKELGRESNSVRLYYASSACSISDTSSAIYTTCKWCTEPSCVLWMSKPFTLPCWSNVCLLCCLPRSHSCATSRHRNGPVGLWRLSHLAHVHPWSNKRPMLLLSHSQSSHGSKPGGARQLLQLQDAIDVPIWSPNREMCSLQFCDINWGRLSKHD